MGSTNPANCPICGDVSVPFTPNLTGTSIFQCFLNLFQGEWKMRRFSFCALCRSHLFLISDLQKKVEELENKIKSHEKVLQARFSCSEVKFERNKLYEKDGRYLSFRKYIRAKVSSQKLDSALPEDDDDDVEEESGAPPRKNPFKGKCIKVEIEDEPMGASILDDVENIMDEVVSEDDKSEANYDEDKERKKEVVKPRRESSSSRSVSEQIMMVEEDEEQLVKSFSSESDDEDEALHDEDTNKTSRSGREVKDFKEQMRARHPATKKLKFKCHLCKKKFQTGGKLRGHVKQTHAVVGGWKCEVCGKDFKFERYLIEHKLVHATVKRFSCNLCGTGFTKNSVMQRHIKNIHEGIPRTDTNRKRRSKGRKSNA